jgi:hypothetical protein
MAITKVSPGLLDLDSGITISTTDNSDNITLISTDADANSGPTLSFFRNSSSPADNDNTGLINFIAENDASEQTTYGSILMQLEDVSNGSEDASFYIQTIKAGSIHTPLLIKGTETIFNEDSVDQDFRVESNSNSSMLFVDGGNDRVGIGDSPSGGQLDVKSQLNMTNSGNVSLFGLKATTFGYSSSYKVLQLGDSASSTSANVAIGVDLSGNSSGSFSGSGERVYFRNGINLATPNSSNDGFHNYLQLNDGQINATVPIAIGGTATANTLDDYEEGNFTPTFVATGGTAPSGQTGTGQYTKIGDVVHITGQITWTGAGSGGGNMYIALPFAVISDSRAGMAIGLNSGVQHSANHQLHLVPELNASLMYVIETQPDSAGHSHLTYGNVVTSGSDIFSFSGCYHTSA